jgi:hypothetical protein
MACPEFHADDQALLRALARRFYLIVAVFPDMEPLDRLGAVAITKDAHKRPDYPGAIPQRSVDAFAWAFRQAVACIKGEVSHAALFADYQSSFGLTKEDVKWQPYSPLNSSRL